MSEFQAIEDWVGGLIHKLTPAQRARLARKAGQALRRSQSQRIAAQKSPDGSPYKPRAKQPGRFRQKQGAIRRGKMFTKLRTARFMKVSASPRDVGVGFMGRTARIAQEHQKGARTTSSRTGRTQVTPQRELLGFSSGDLDIVRDTILNHLADN